MFNYDTNDDNIPINNDCMTSIYNTKASSKLSEIDCSIVSLCLCHSKQVSTSFCRLNPTFPCGNLKTLPQVFRPNINDKLESESYIKVKDNTINFKHQNSEDRISQYEKVLSPKLYLKENRSAEEANCFISSKINLYKCLENPLNTPIVQEYIKPYKPNVNRNTLNSIDFEKSLYKEEYLNSSNLMNLNKIKMIRPSVFNSLSEIQEFKGDVDAEKTDTNENYLNSTVTNSVPLYSVKNSDKNNDYCNKNDFEANFMRLDNIGDINVNFYKGNTTKNTIKITETENNLEIYDEKSYITPLNPTNNYFDHFSNGPGDPKPSKKILSVKVAPQHVVKHGSNDPSPGLTKVSC